MSALLRSPARAGITGLLTVLASSALGVWRWTSFRNTSEYLFQWQLITLLGFYLLALAVGAWMVPSNLAGLDTAVLVLDTLIVLALLLRLLTTLESPSDYEQIGYAKTPPVQYPELTQRLSRGCTVT